MRASETKGEQRLSFVLPVTLKEKGLSSNPRMLWRQSPNDAAASRTRLLLASFLKNFRQDDLEDFFVICPVDDVGPVSRIVASLTDDSRYQVVSDFDICPDVNLAIDPCTQEIVGWYAQQLIKLAMSAYISTNHYVTLDSDILCIRPFEYSHLVRGNRALTNTETPSDYQRIYTHEFSLRETAAKLSRYRISREFLAYARPRALLYRFYGETPVVLRTKSVRALTRYLDTRFQQSWPRTLVRNAGWTEYSLYFQFLEMEGQLETVCALAGCNAVLDLEKSVWHESKHYRRLRFYDAAHFNAQKSESEGGYFVAIQSWLDAPSWLPQRCRTLTDFYSEVQEWLLNG